MPASDILDITVPQEDGAIREALADLDRKLAVHAAAVRDAEARLREIVQSTEAPAPRVVEETVEEESPPAEVNVTPVPPQRMKDLSTPAPADKKKPAEPAAEMQIGRAHV